MEMRQMMDEAERADLKVDLEQAQARIAELEAQTAGARAEFDSEIAFRWRQTTTLYDWEALDLIPAQVAYAVLARLGLPSGILQAVERHFTERVTTEDDLIRWRRAMIVALPAQDECK